MAGSTETFDIVKDYAADRPKSTASRTHGQGKDLPVIEACRALPLGGGAGGSVRIADHAAGPIDQRH
ncbi:hypothetical protein GCM10028864_50160 [Microlunatus parietis]